MNATFAGRSASRRMRYGYHCVPNGHVDAHAVPLAHELLLQVAPHAVEHLEFEAVRPIRCSFANRFASAMIAGSCVAMPG